MFRIFGGKLRCSIRSKKWGGQSQRLLVGGLTEALDRVGDIAELRDFEAEILAYLYRLSQADDFVINQQVDILIGILFKLNHGPDIQFNGLADLHFLLGYPHYDRNFHIEDSLEVLRLLIGLCVRQNSFDFGNVGLRLV